MCLSLFLDYEMSTLPKHSSASQGAKLAKIEQEYEVPAEEKTMEIISNPSSVDARPPRLKSQWKPTCGELWRILTAHKRG